MDLLSVKKKIDITMVGVVALLVIYGLVAVYSATQSSAYTAGDPFYFLKKQILALVIGVVGLLIASFSNYNRWKRYLVPAYLLNVGMLVAVDIIGSTHKGAQKWILVGGFQLQPSELSKVLLIITLAGFLASRKTSLDSIQDLALTLAHVTVPMLLVFLQPDLGTALCYAAIMLGMMLVAGFPARHFAIILVGGIIMAFFAIQFGVLHEYQLNRLAVFINPDSDPRGAAYNLLQSKIAVGSGQLAGKGLFSGTQARLQFLPERHTDFIFSVIGEELGFIGASLLLVLFFVLVMRGIRVAVFSKNVFGSMLVAGVVSLWLFQLLVNVGMTIGLMPITGIPLPFVSYGNSSLIAHLIAVGILLNVYARSYV